MQRGLIYFFTQITSEHQCSLRIQTHDAIASTYTRATISHPSPGLAFEVRSVRATESLQAREVAIHPDVVIRRARALAVECRAADCPAVCRAAARSECPVLPAESPAVRSASAHQVSLLEPR
jgi:hypothetical protein